MDDVMELLEFILTTTYVCFRGQIYRQKFGTAMGSPVSPLVANLFMEYLEQKLLDTAPMEMKPRLWKRYVDDIFIFEVVKKSSVEGPQSFSITWMILAALSLHMKWNQRASYPFWTC